jgi:hypothetical protein
MFIYLHFDSQQHLYLVRFEQQRNARASKQTFFYLPSPSGHRRKQFRGGMPMIKHPLPINYLVPEASSNICRHN